jgi:hypothetical protein
LIGESYDAYLDYLHKIQGHTHGMAVFERDQKEDSQRNNYWLAQARVDGEVVGVMMYDLRGEELMHFKLTASRFYYHTSQGRYLLLAWIARHIDQADRVELRLPPFEHPETWQADMEIEIAAHFVPPMGRVVDVAKIGGMQTSAGHFSARVRDSLCPWNEGVWQFETVDGQLQVSKGGEAACDLNIQALAALVYGTHDPGDFAIKDWGTPPPAVQTVMRTMFPRLIPYLHESY